MVSTAVGPRPLAEDEGPDAPGIAEGQDAYVVDQHDDGVAAGASLHGGSNRGDRRLVDGLAARQRVPQRLGEDVEQYFRVGIRVQVPVTRDELALQRVGVGEVPVVREPQAARIVDVKGLAFLRRAAARRWIAHVADAHVAHKCRDRGRMREDVAD